MNLGELQAWVNRTIKRPEKAAEIVDAINAAIEFIATQGDFAFDLVEGTLSSPTISATEYAQTISISSSFPRFRKAKYFRPGTYNKVLTWCDSSRIFEGGREKVDVWYRGGDNIVFKVCHLITTMKYGYYAYPARLSSPSSTNNYTNQMSAAVHALACAQLWEEIGNEAEAQRYERRANRYILAHKSDKQDGASFS